MAMPLHGDTTSTDEFLKGLWRENPVFVQVLGMEDRNSLLDFVDQRVQPRLAAVPGISRVMAGGGAPREMTVRIDPDRCAARGVSPTQVTAALARSVRRLRFLGGVEDGGLTEGVIPIRGVVDLVGRIEIITEVEIGPRRGPRPPDAGPLQRALDQAEGLVKGRDRASVVAAAGDTVGAARDAAEIEHDLQVTAAGRQSGAINDLDTQFEGHGVKQGDFHAGNRELDRPGRVGHGPRGDPRDRGEAPPRDLDVDPLEIVLPGTFDPDHLAYPVPAAKHASVNRRGS